MGWFNHDEAQESNNYVYGYDGRVQEEHKSSFTHEAIAGAAGFEAMKAYEDHLKKEGKPVTHSTMKELLAGFAMAEVDKLAETKGLDFIDREEAKHKAKHQAHHLAEQRYGEGNTGYEYVQQNY